MKPSNARASANHWTQRHRKLACLAYRVTGLIQFGFMLAILFVVVYVSAILAGVP